MPSSTGFGLGDSPFTTSGFGSFDELSRSVAARTSSASSGGSSGSSSGGGLFDSLLGAVGKGVETIADFGTKLFIYDELSERGQTSATNNTTTNTGTGGVQTTASSGTASTSFITGVPNEVLYIGLSVVVVLLFLMKVK